MNPVFDHIHTLFVAAREIVPVIAFEQRTHGEKIFDGDFRLARVGILQRLFVGKERKDGDVNAREQAFVDGDADQHVRHGFGSGARVAKR